MCLLMFADEEGEASQNSDRTDRSDSSGPELQEATNSELINEPNRCHFTDLPTEIIMKICQFLVWPPQLRLIAENFHSVESVLALSAVNKAFRSCVLSWPLDVAFTSVEYPDPLRNQEDLNYLSFVLNKTKWQVRTITLRRYVSPGVSSLLLLNSGRIT